ncbi:hypothetical protein [Thermomonospora curvata]|uniref:Uncharacterized protein n=1 Tax=Thermomonospora curvata (strain ATCC 19995 / DSM 43183 / JCM 3096 / KCTC 9072 / NBRC 15933 / NCIMB 10081 / Henssen B9) TaxID=471852 RepID=D1A8W1_THECD|nr:hypothetical protein [Thermomonospora curvata]ACY98599.1 hypothetical protein Tcur_3057 [Thermomonospora curvata DSM 43183]
MGSLSRRLHVRSPRYDLPQRRAASGTPVHAHLKSGQAVATQPAPILQTPPPRAQSADVNRIPRTERAAWNPGLRGCRRGSGRLPGPIP